MVFGARPVEAPGEIVEIERPASGKLHAGKVLAAVQAHADDIPFFCSGTVAKLLEEGYTGYLIQTTNDDKCGPTPSVGETVLSNERDVDQLARALGFKAVINLGYRNHFLDGESPLELRCRLIFLFRALKVDTVLTFNPWGEGERNPDHVVTARAVEAATWMSGMDKDYPEQFAAGIAPHAVSEVYWWVARHGQPCNRVVDVSAYTEKMVEAMVANTSQGPGGASGSQLRARLAAEGRRLPALERTGTDDASVDREYARLFLLTPFRELGERYGLDYAEAFYYVHLAAASRVARDVQEYVARYAEAIR